jgi:hypothetical protein
VPLMLLSFVFCVFTSRCLVATSNGGRSPYSGFPIYPCASVTSTNSNSSQGLKSSNPLTHSLTHQPTHSIPMQCTNSAQLISSTERPPLTSRHFTHPTRTGLTSHQQLATELSIILIPQFLNSTPLLPSSYPGRLTSRNSTDTPLPSFLNLPLLSQESPSILSQLPEISLYSLWVAPTKNRFLTIPLLL